MNLGDLQDLVYSWLDDPNRGYFTEAQVNVWLNNAQRECQKQLVQAGEAFFVKRVSTATVENYDTYALPSDFMRLHKLEIVISGTGVNENRQGVGYVTPIQIDQVSMTAGRPCNYTLRKNCIVMRPIPDNIYTIYMDYTPLVSDMTAYGSIPDIPPRYHEYLAVLAAFDGFLKDQRDPTPFLTKKQFYLDLMKQDAAERHVDSPREVITTDAFEIGYLF